MELYKQSACSLLKKLHNQEITSVELATALLDRIDEINPSINAIMQVDRDRVLAEAKAADQKIASGKGVGLLCGLPISIKDTCHVEGFKCSRGFQGLLDKPSTYSATAVQRLKEAGAIILGLTNVPELLLSYETDNPVYGRTNNPFDAKLTPGGSSGGEAALIAAGGSVLGLGSDAGGSVRQPAHYCGIAAIKPTQGLIPWDGTIPEEGVGLIGQLLTFGPMARYVEDLELMLKVMQGPTPRDPYSQPFALQSSDMVDLSGLKIAYFNDVGSVKADADTQRVMKSTMKALSSYVQSVQQDCPSMMHETKILYETFFFGGSKARWLTELLKAQAKDYRPSKLLQQFIARGEKTDQLDASGLLDRLVQVDRYRMAMEKFMTQYDVLICPTAATPALPHGTTHARVDELSSYLVPFNITGWPSVTICCGYAENGLPIGLQVIAKKWHDHVALAVAKRLQSTFKY